MFGKKIQFQMYNIDEYKTLEDKMLYMEYTYSSVE